MHLVKSYVRFKFFWISDFAELLGCCLICVRMIKISLFFNGFCTNMRTSRIYGETSLLYEVPGGNQVDGLPPVASSHGFNHLQCRTCSMSLPGGNLVDGLPPVEHMTRRASSVLLESTSESKLPYGVFGEEYPRRV